VDLWCRVPAPLLLFWLWLDPSGGGLLATAFITAFITEDRETIVIV
jgi:hypothetical protein